MTLAIDATPIAAIRDQSETNDTGLQLFASCALVLLSGGACSCQLKGFYELVRLNIAISRTAASWLADLLQNVSVASEQSIDTACDTRFR